MPTSTRVIETANRPFATRGHRAGASIRFIERGLAGPRTTAAPDRRWLRAGGACGAPRRDTASVFPHGRHGAVKARGCHNPGATGVENRLRSTGAAFLGAMPFSRSRSGETLPPTRSSSTSARARPPPIPRLGRVPYLTNTSMMAVDFRPPTGIPAAATVPGSADVPIFLRRCHADRGQPRLGTEDEIGRGCRFWSAKVAVGSAQALSVARRHNGTRSRSDARRAEIEGTHFGATGVGRTPTISD